MIKDKIKNYAFVISLIMLTFITTLLLWSSDDVSARYVSSAYGSSTARVAKFDVSVIQDEGNMSLDVDNRTETYSITVKSSSEVSVGYKIKLSLASALPKGMSISLNGQAFEGDGKTSTYVFDGYTMPYGENVESSHTLTFTLTPSIMGEDYASDVSIEVLVEQLQSNGAI